MLLKRGKAIEKMEKLNDQLWPELEKLEHYNQYLVKERRKQDSVIDQKRFLLETLRPKQRPWTNFYSSFETKTL